MRQDEYEDPVFAVVRSMYEEVLAHHDYHRRSKLASPAVRDIFRDVASEEYEHLGEFFVALAYMLSKSDSFLRGVREACRRHVGRSSPRLARLVCKAVVEGE